MSEWRTDPIPHPTLYPLGTLMRAGSVGPLGVVIAWKRTLRRLRLLHDGSELEVILHGATRAWALCEHCDMEPEDHAYGKCLFDATTYAESKHRLRRW